MELLLARNTLNSKPKKIKIEDLEKKIQKERFFYLDRENEHKTLNEMMEYFEEKGFSVHLREVRYALGELDFIYELHLV